MSKHIPQYESQHEFIRRGLAAEAEARRTGVYYSVADVLRDLDRMLKKAQDKAANRSQADTSRSSRLPKAKK